MGSWASASIGYVTGNNDYFHLSKQQVDELGVDSEFVLPALRRADELKGLVYSEHDWSAAAEAGGKSYVLSASSAEEDLPGGVRSYLVDGRARAASTSPTSAASASPGMRCRACSRPMAS